MRPRYDSSYYEWQRDVGRLAAAACGFLYEPYVGPRDTVLDFGCGGGFMLARLTCGVRLGVEVNPVAREEAARQGLAAHASLDEVPPGSVDVIISNHALEHVEDPLAELRKMRRILRPGGRLVIVTPFERRSRWRPGDINQHLFTWSPMNLGNLVGRAGFEVRSAEVVAHRFPPGGLALRRFLGPRLFHLLCLVWGRIYHPVTQVRVVAVAADAPEAARP